MPARVATGRVPAGRMSATIMAASTPMAAATVLGFSKCDKTDREYHKHAGHESTRKLRGDKAHMLSP